MGNAIALEDDLAATVLTAAEIASRRAAHEMSDPDTEIVGGQIRKRGSITEPPRVLGTLPQGTWD
jgi:hypothetical protein